VYGVKLDDRGQAICTGNPDLCGTPERPNDPIVLKVSAGLGEPKRFGLISHDRRAKAFVSVVPFPVTGSDAACSVGAILLTKNGEAVLVEGNGFAPDAEIHLEANSQGEVRNSVVNADDKGNFYQIELPYVEGKSSGTVKVTAQAKTCSPSLTLNWGTDSYRIQ